MADVYVFGDSNAWGAFDDKGGWVDRLKQYFLQEKIRDFSTESVSITNLAVSGDASDNILSRIEGEIAVRRKRWSSPNDLFIVVIGGNDSRLKGPERVPYSSVERYASNLGEIISVIKKTSHNVLLVGITPVIDSLANFPDTSYTIARRNEFNDALKQFCIKSSLAYLDVDDIDTEAFLCPDGLHLNSSGHEWMYERIKPIVIDMLSSSTTTKE
mgnify:CR=1 FL=1